MSKLLAVFGATGRQGSSVVRNALSDPEIARRYRVRAITRDPGSDKAEQLRALGGVEVVRGDAADPASLARALAGADTVFAMTTPSFGPGALEAELAAARAIADAAVAQGARYLIFSTLPSPGELSGGRYTGVTPFEAKARAERYIRGLPIRSAFFAGGFFMENFASQPFLAPRRAADGTYVLARPHSAETGLPFFDAVGDTGKFVNAILAEPEKYEGKTICAAQAVYTITEIAAIMSRATGKTVVFKQISVEEFKNSLPSFIADILGDGFSFQEEYGYFGPKTKELVAWGSQQARGRLTTLSEFFEEHPLHLD